MNLRENVGILDSAIRCVVAIVMFVMVTEGLLTGAVAMTAGGIGIVMMLTASFGNCPLYKLIGINTWGNVKHHLIEH